MRVSFLLSIAFCSMLLFTHALSSQQQPGSEYDARLAASLGADDYGMRQYVLVILKTGPKKCLPAKSAMPCLQAILPI